MSEVLERGEPKYKELTAEKKCKVLGEILHLFQCNSVASNLSSIDGAQRAGVLTQPKNLSDSDEIYLINQSVTGFFEKKVRLAPYKEE